MLRHCLFLCGMLLGMVVPPPAAANQAPQDEVYQYVQRLGAERLQIAWLTRELEQYPDALQSESWAEDLAALIVARMVGGEEATDAAADTKRLKALLENYPKLRTPALEASIAYADFKRVERLCQSAFDEPSTYASINVVAELQTLATRLARLREQWTAEAQVTAPNELEANDSPQNESRLREGLTRQVQFLQAWTHFYQGVFATSPEQKLQQWRDANGAFRAILQIPPERDLTEIDADWFELSLAPMARVLLGLGITEQALGNDPSADYCFAMLDSSPVPRSIRDSIGQWRLRGFAFARQWERATEWLRKNRASGFSLVPVALAQAAGSATPPPNAPADDPRFALLNEILWQLVNANELELADRILAAESGQALKIDDPFYRHWLEARRAFERGEREHRPGDYRQAFDQATAALESTGGTASPRRAVELRSIIAWSLSRCGQWIEAAREFQQLSYLLRAIDENASAEAAWNGIQALLQATASDSAIDREIEAAFDEFGRLYASSPLAPRVELARLEDDARRGKSPQALELLRAITADDPRFAAAQLALCRVHHARFVELQAAEDPTAESHYQSLEELAARNSDPKSSLTDEDRARIVLIAADAALQSRPPRADSVEKWITRGAPLLAGRGENDGDFAQWQAIRFRWGTISENQPMARELALWLVDHGPTAEFRMMGMMYLANQLDQELTAEPNDATLQERGIQFYRQLTRELGDTLPDLQRSQNAFVAMAKLAELELLANRLADAERHLDLLRAAAPNDLSMLQKSARCKTGLGKEAEALELWRRIARGTDEREAWLEAKYHIAVCLAKTSPEDARQVLQQTLSLAAELPEPWRQRFDQLQKQLPVPVKQ